MAKTLVNLGISNKGAFLRNLKDLCDRFNKELSPEEPLDLVGLNNMSLDEFARSLDSIQKNCANAQDIQNLVTQLREAIAPLTVNTTHLGSTEKEAKPISTDTIYASLKEAMLAAKQSGMMVVPIKQGRAIFYKLEHN